MAAGIPAEGKPEMYRFGELSVARVRRILAGDETPEPVPPKGKPPELCQGCSHRGVFEVLRDMDCIVAGDIGCYTLGVLPPFSAMDTCVCMGASIGVGLGLRHVLPEDQARRVVSVIGDSTFVHSGITGVAEMVYNPPATGHVDPDPGQRHHRHDRAAGAPGDRAHPEPRPHGQDQLRGPGPGHGGAERPCSGLQ